MQRYQRLKLEVTELINEVDQLEVYTWHAVTWVTIATCSNLNRVYTASTQCTNTPIVYNSIVHS